MNGADGVDGTAGVSTALLTVYQTSTAQPTTPTGGSYDFDTNTLTAPAGWVANVPASVSGMTTFASEALASVVGQTGTDSTLTWGAPRGVFRDGADGNDGMDGAAGLSVFEAIVYARPGNVTPNTPTGG